jgi:hypothetical protein
MRHIWSAAALVTALWIGAADARYTCTSVARRGDMDPDGFVFTNKFDESTGVNAAGVVVFVARAGNLQQALYRYPNGGPNTVIARVGDPAPGGSAFTRFGAGCFGAESINTAGVVGFVARLAIGQGVFVDVGGVLEKAAQTTDTSPGGGTFVDFPSASEINDASAVAFVANVSGGPSGIFLYDAVLNTLVTVLDTSDTDSTARPFCSFEEVGLSDTDIAFTATVGNPTCATPLEGVFHGATGIPIAVAGDVSPIGGSNYVEFIEAPEPGPTGVITFQAKVTGVLSGAGIFSTAGPSKVVAAGDFAPDVGGSVKKPGLQHRQDGNGDVITRLFLRQTTAKHGIFRYDATPEAAVVKTDAPPAPPFGPLSKYRAISDASAASTGTTIAFRAKMKDTIKPGSKTGVLRCVP